MGDLDWHLQFVCQFLKLEAPQADAVAVAATAISGDEQACGNLLSSRMRSLGLTPALTNTWAMLIGSGA